MNDAVWIYWFPIVIVVALASAFLGRTRGVALAVLASAYWLGMSLPNIQTPTSSMEILPLIGLLAGMIAIVATGWWMSTNHDSKATRKSGKTTDERGTPQKTQDIWDTLGEVITRLNDWLSTSQQRVDPWPEFGEALRSCLVAACGATHIRAYRLLATDDDQLYPLRRTDPDENDFPSTRSGIIGHVVTTGKSYYTEDPSQGSLVNELAESSERHCSWCFAIKQNHRTIGVVEVGALGDTPLTDKTRLPILEGVISTCWISLTESCRSRVAGFTDPVSGVLTHNAFINAAERSLQDSYDHGEPAVMMNISVEGLRTLADNGQWDLANQLLFEVSSEMKKRLRHDDEIGVFDGSRYLLLMRRVDSELAVLIADQLMNKLTKICENNERWGTNISVRCGLAGTGVGRPPLATLVAKANDNCQIARKQGETIISDVVPIQEGSQG